MKKSYYLLSHKSSGGEVSLQVLPIQTKTLKNQMEMSKYHFNITWESHFIILIFKVWLDDYFKSYQNPNDLKKCKQVG